MKLKLFICTTLLLGSISQKSLAESEHKHDHEKEQQATAHQDEDEHGGEHGGHEEAEGVKLSAKQQSLANIKVEILRPKIMNHEVYAPAEIKTNGYTSYLVSPRVDAVVLKRYVTLGEHVEKNQRLVRLFSEAVADAQASFRVARSEWLRVKKLGRKSIGDKRYIKAQVDYDAAYGRLSAFGLSKNAIQAFIKNPKNFGEYYLTAINSGVVLADDFHQGQKVSTGQTLIELADEKTLWVEARLPALSPLKLSKDMPVKIKVGQQTFMGKVAQEFHTIDPNTRTRIVRLLVNNQAHQLHAGLFAEVYFPVASKKAILAVPESALMRGADGDWTIFVEEEPNQFSAKEIERGQAFGDWYEITGIHAGERVVMQGAFFVASEIAKGSFDPHNH